MRRAVQATDMGNFPSAPDRRKIWTVGCTL